MNNWGPTWSNEATLESIGLYPLGLNRFHMVLESLLITSIVTTTRRLRFISHYTWILGDIEKTEKFAQYNDFVKSFNLRQNAFAIGLYMKNPNSGMDGSFKLRDIVKDNKEVTCPQSLVQF